MSARGGVIQFRVSVEERARIDVNAREAGLPLSVFVRARALGAVSEPLSDASTAARQSVHGDGLSAHEPAVPGPASPRAPGDKRAVIEGLRGQMAGVAEPESKSCLQCDAAMAAKTDEQGRAVWVCPDCGSREKRVD